MAAVVSLLFQLGTLFVADAAASTSNFQQQQRLPAVLASDLLRHWEQQQQYDQSSWHNFTTTSILRFISIHLDDNGAWEWSLWFVAVITTLALGAVRLVGQKRGGIDWYALVHAIISATGSLMIVYLDVVVSREVFTNQPPYVGEPHRSCLCYGPMTSLHRIIPAITMGYSLYDLLDGLRISYDFAAHGAATLAILAFFCIMVDAPQFIAPLLCMEVSTVFLVLVGGKFWSEPMALLNQLCFVLSFLLFRCILAPILHYQVISAMIQHRSTWQISSACYPWYLLPVSLVFGLFFHGLNLYWFVKIIRKVQRKLKGQEDICANNDISDPKNHIQTPASKASSSNGALPPNSNKKVD